MSDRLALDVGDLDMLDDEGLDIASLLASEAQQPVEPPIDNRTAMRRALGRPPQSLVEALKALGP